MKFSSEFSYEDFIAGINKTGIKIKEKNIDSKIQGFTTVELFNAETGALEQRERCENVISENKFNSAYTSLQLPYQTIGVEYKQNYRSEHMQDGAHYIDLRFDTADVVESGKIKLQDGDRIGHAYNWGTYSGTDPSRGTILPNLTYQYEDYNRKAHVSVATYEFTTLAANGTFNLVMMRSQDGQRGTPHPLAYEYKDDRYSHAFRALTQTTTQHFSKPFGPYVYSIPQYRRSTYRGKTVTLERFDMRKTYEQGVDEATGSWKATVEDCREILCSIDFNDPDLTDFYSETSNSYWANSLKHMEISQDGQHIYIGTHTAYNEYTISKIEVSSGNKLTTWVMDTSAYCYNTDQYRRNAFYMSADESVIYLGVADFRNCVFLKIDASDMTILTESVKKKLTTTTESGNAYISYLVPMNVEMTEFMVMTATTHGTSLSYDEKINYWNTDLGLFFEQTASVPDYSYYSQTYFLYWNPVLKCHHGLSFDRTGALIQPLDSGNVMSRNVLPVPITKNNSQIMRVQYEFVIPWDSVEREGYSTGIEWNSFARPQSVEITNKVTEIILGNTHQLSWDMLPTYSLNKDVVFTSNSESTATVDGNGLITTVALGAVTVDVTTVDGNHIDSMTFNVISA